MFDYPTIEALAANLLERMVPAAAPGSGSSASSAPATAVPAVLGKDAVAAMSDAEIEALLVERLGKS
jgi:hypothetical protein